MTKGRGFNQPSALNLTQMTQIQHFKNLTKWQDSLQLLTKHF
jgi:hypothetical protein